jgi:hypothetical protein
MKKFSVLFIVFFLIVFFQSNSYSQCGKERWPVKTLTDKDTVKINFANVIKSTVHKQCKMKRPSKVYGMPRLASERKVYEIEAYVVEYKKEDDHDYHIVIQDLITGEDMIAEVIDPECPGISSTSRYKDFKKVRDWFTTEFKPTESFKNTLVKVKLTGVGFFDHVHGKLRGHADNYREIHPILKMEYLK